MLIEDEKKTSSWVLHSFEKIYESFEKLKLSELDFKKLMKYQWVVTEKIHGANFSLTTDGIYVKYAKRKEFLNPTEDFFGHRSIIPKLVPKVQNLFFLISNEIPGIHAITLYGELFGGSYPHPDIKPNTSVEAIQTGVYYSPDIEFCAFDISFHVEGSEAKYLDYDKAMELLEESNMMYAKPLMVGKFHEALDFDIHYKTTIPERLGYPQLEYENKAEGVVIKPVKSIYIQTQKGYLRPIIKKKISAFQEEHYHQAEKWSYDHVHKKNITKNPALIMSELSTYITTARLNNAVSKVGKVLKGDVQKIRELHNLLKKDIIECLDEKYDNPLGLMGENEKAVVLSYLDGEIQKLINTHL